MADGVFTPTGQSSAADAMNTMTCAYDFLKYEFNRLGPDGTDAAMTADVNNESYTGGYGWQTLATVGTDPVTGKAINVPFQLMRFGTGVPAAGMTNLAEPTIIGTAIGHMLWEDLLGYPSTSSIDDYKNVTQAFAQLMSMGIYSLGALHGTMRTALIAPWIYGGVYANGGYTTSMFHPSLDGVSPDYSYDGSYLIGNPSSLYGAGPFNRAFFFMAEGASAKPTSNSYSTFMPGGMPGIGLEKTCKIAYKAVSENLASHNANGPIMRAAMIQAASDLYGPGSPEVIATTNAWAAVNVGGSYGNADPIRVWFDMQNFPADSDLGIKGPFEPNPRAVRYPYAPAGEPTQMKANISGTTNTGLTWTVNPAPYSSSGYYDLSTTADGNITASGLYQGPLRQDTGSINVTSIQATSTADPNQFAQGMVFNITFDWDGDGNNDALDLGYLADEIPKAIKETLEGIARVTSIVRAMKDFSHPGGAGKAPVDLNKAIDSTLTVSRSVWKPVAELQQDLDPELAPVLCFQGEINQAVLNLVVNAAQAIDEALDSRRTGRLGVIRIATRQVGREVRISVSDTGHGIPEAIRNRIFEPFFTTKPVGKGTGQGLAIVHSVVVDKHGGRVTVETAPGLGTTFHLFLPVG